MARQAASPSNPSRFFSSASPSILLVLVLILLVAHVLVVLVLFFLLLSLFRFVPPLPLSLPSRLLLGLVVPLPPLLHPFLPRPPSPPFRQEQTPPPFPPTSGPEARGPGDPPAPAPAQSFGDRVACPFATVTAAFYHQAASPSARGRVTVRDLSGGAPRELTYAQLATRAQALAARLRRLGFWPCRCVPLVVRRGADMVVAIWAVLSCGAQYVPLDGGVVPDAVLAHVVEQAGRDAVVLCLGSTEHRVRDRCPHATPVVVERALAEDPAEDPAEPAPAEWVDGAEPDAGCYVIYTSDSSGQGVGRGVDAAALTGSAQEPRARPRAST